MHQVDKLNSALLESVQSQLAHELAHMNKSQDILNFMAQLISEENDALNAEGSFFQANCEKTTCGSEWPPGML